jgi:hypothetical protein
MQVSEVRTRDFRQARQVKRGSGLLSRSNKSVSPNAAHNVFYVF